MNSKKKAALNYRKDIAFWGVAPFQRQLPKGPNFSQNSGQRTKHPFRTKLSLQLKSVYPNIFILFK